MLYIGIDPGFTGAVAVIDTDFDMVSFWDTPTAQVKTAPRRKTVQDVLENRKPKHGVKQEYLPSQMAVILRDLKDANCHVWLEKVGAMPGQGVTSMFRFGVGFGLWQGIIAALELPMTLVTPQAWKKEIMVAVSDKDATRIKAQSLYPSCVKDLCMIKHQGRADALMIAEYGRRTFKVSPPVGKNK